MIEEPIADQEVRRFRWWYKGRAPEGTTCSFAGTGFAKDSQEALETVEKLMRGKYPQMRWMQGREMEGRGVLLGPTVQMQKTRKPAAKLEPGERFKLVAKTEVS